MYNLLLVDDESLLRKGIRSLIDLKQLHIDQVFEAANGAEAIDIVKTEPIDIVLMDINMPDVDGITASESIKKYNKNIYVIILTGYDYFEYARASIRARVDDYILKPVSKKDIEYILKTTIKHLDATRKQTIIQKLCRDDNIDTVIDINTAYQLISANLETNIYRKDFSLTKLATAIGYNSSYLSVLFKQIYNMPFQDYLNMRKMDKAKLLLLTTDMKNSEIAAAVGIEDVNYFIAKFKKHFAVSPQQYRQEITNEE